jgi:hypothetical protein
MARPMRIAHSTYSMSGSRVWVAAPTLRRPVCRKVPTTPTTRSNRSPGT